MLASEHIFSNKKVKTIKKELLINGGDLDLYLDLFLTDKNGHTEKILSKKGDSILANFMRILYKQMCRDNRSNVMGGTFYYWHQNFVGSQISSLSDNGSGEIRITFTSSIVSGIPNTGKVSLGGFQGLSIDGRYDYTKISSSIIDIDGSTYVAGWTSGTGGGDIAGAITSLSNPDDQAFSNYGIIIGTGTTPVLIDDFSLEKPIPSLAANGGLVYGSSTVAQDTNDSTSAQITFTRAFTNNASLTVTVNELGLLLDSGGVGKLLCMRDILATGVNVANGATLTVNYRIKTTLGTGTDPGGFLASFMRLLYRQIAQTTRAIFDIDNTSRTTHCCISSMGAIKCGGMNIESPGDGELQPGYKFGIVLGRGNTAVAMGDYYLETEIPHGVGTNEMLYYGGFAEDFTVGGDYAEFSITKAIENNSGAQIDVYEYILTGASDSNTSLSSISRNFVYLYTLTRNVLSSPVAVQDGEILKVIYTIRCVVGGGSS